jgi:YidC/Oxa1 family membrane protein insertase
MFASIAYFYNLIIYIPLYNGLIGLMDLFPWMDAGVAIIVFTIIIRLVLFPLSRKSIKTQIRMREIQPEIAALQKKFPNKQEQMAKTMELYKKHNIRPLAGALILFIQLPILLGLYYVFTRSGLPVVNAAILYSFVHSPVINMNFLGLLDISKTSITMAAIAAASQYLQLRFSLASQAATNGDPNNPAAAMSKQMRYLMPVMIFILAFRFPAAISLYWTIGNLFMLGQELFVRFHHERGKKKLIGLN